MSHLSDKGVWYILMIFGVIGTISGVSAVFYPFDIVIATALFATGITTVAALYSKFNEKEPPLGNSADMDASHHIKRD